MKTDEDKQENGGAALTAARKLMGGVQISVEGAVGLLIGIMAWISEINWWFRSVLVIACLLLWAHVTLHLAKYALTRAMLLLVGFLVVLSGTWHPIFEGVKTSFNTGEENSEASGKKGTEPPNRRAPGDAAGPSKNPHLGFEAQPMPVAPAHPLSVAPAQPLPVAPSQSSEIDPIQVIPRGFTPSKPSPKTEEPPPARKEPAPQDFTKASPDILKGLLKGKYGESRSGIIEQFKGKWMFISGNVIPGIDHDKTTGYRISIETGDFNQDFLSFDDNKREYIIGLKKEQRIRALCQIDQLTEAYIELIHCEPEPN